MSQKKGNFKRVVVYLPEEEHRMLRLRLALSDMSVSEWFREHVRKLLYKDENKS